MKRKPSRFATLLLLVSLLLAQWAVATYACAMPSSAAVAMAASDMADMDCGEEPEQRSLLCVLHCDGDQASGQSQPAAPDLPAWVPLLIAGPVAVDSLLPRVADVGYPDV